MPINSCIKGKVGEREVAALLKQYGFEAKRGQQHAGGADSPDVVHDMDGFHIEVKRVENLSLYTAMDQAIRDSQGSTNDPIIFHRRSRKPWLIIMDAEAFLRLMVKYVYTTETIGERNEG